MLPDKSHLQMIVKELEKFESDREKSYNFYEFFIRCASIFEPNAQKTLNSQIKQLENDFYMSVLDAQDVVYKTRMGLLPKMKRLRVHFSDDTIERIPLNVSKLEKRFHNIILWCRKQIIKIVKDEQVQFDKITKLDLEGFSNA